MECCPVRPPESLTRAPFKCHSHYRPRWSSGRCSNAPRLLCQGHSHPTSVFDTFMNDNRREAPQQPTRDGKSMPELMSEYVFTQRQVQRTIQYT